MDGDGFISREDFHAAMIRNKAKVGNRTPAQLDQMFKSVDRKGTGMVDFETFAGMRVRKKKMDVAGCAPPLSIWILVVRAVVSLLAW